MDTKRKESDIDKLIKTLEEENLNLKNELNVLKKEMIQNENSVISSENTDNKKIPMLSSISEYDDKHRIFLIHLLKNSDDILILINNDLTIAYCSDSFLKLIDVDKFQKIANLKIIDIYKRFNDNKLFDELNTYLSFAIEQDIILPHDVFLNIDDHNIKRAFRVTNTPIVEKNVKGYVFANLRFAPTVGKRDGRRKKTNPR